MAGNMTAGWHGTGTVTESYILIYKLKAEYVCEGGGEERERVLAFETSKLP